MHLWKVQGDMTLVSVMKADQLVNDLFVIQISEFVFADTHLLVDAWIGRNVIVITQAIVVQHLKNELATLAAKGFVILLDAIVWA